MVFHGHKADVAFVAQPNNNRLKGAQKNGHIHPKAHVLDVKQVELQFARRGFHAGRIGIVNLRPSGNAGLHQVGLL